MSRGESLKFLKDSKIFAGLIFIILVGLVVLIYNHVSFLFIPLEALFASLFIPILIAVFLYYIFLPIYDFLKKKLPSDTAALFILFALIGGIFYLMFSLIIPNLINEISSFLAMIPSLIDIFINWIEEQLSQTELSSVEIAQDIIQYINNFDISITNMLSNLASGLTVGIASMFSFFTRSTIVMFTVPIILLFLYKDGHKFPKSIEKITPKKYKTVVNELMEVSHKNAAAYIGGRILVCLYVGVSSYLVFLFLGLPNPLLLGLICGILDIIPYFGPFIGASPAFLIALTMSWSTALIVAIVITIVQFGESYLVSPLVMGRSLHMHPLTVMLLLLFAHQLFGLIGMILALPCYSVLKECAKTIYKFIKEQKGDKLSFLNE